MDAGQLLGFFANGLVFGGILALGAIGLTLVYGILKLSNFAHGDFLTLGAFASFFFAVEHGTAAAATALVVASVVALALLADFTWTRRLVGGERIAIAAFVVVLALAGAWLGAAYDSSKGTTNGLLVVAGLLAAAVTVAFLVGLEYLLWRPLRRRRATVLSYIIVSIGAALVIRNALLFQYGGSNRSYARATPISDNFFGARVSDAQQFALLAALLLILAVHLFLRHTRTGKALRALSDNADLARVSGINVDRMVLYVWALAGILAAAAGVLLTLTLNNNMHVNMGFGLIVPLFAAVLLGGIGSAYGAMAGGFIVGVAMKTSVLWWGTEYELAAAFAILILVMLVRPQGLFGGRA